MSAEYYLRFVPSEGPIRVGCFVIYYNKSQGEIFKGTIIRSTYSERSKKNHIFIIENDKGILLMENATRLYSCLIKHIPGKISQNERKEFQAK